jgi:phosphatidylglycerophosphate synthase
MSLHSVSVSPQLQWPGLPTLVTTLRLRVALTALVGLGLTLLASLWVGRLFHLSSSFPSLAAVSFAAGMALVLTVGLPHHPFPRFGAANLVTTARLMLVALVAGLVPQPASARGAWLVVALAMLCTALDGVDGWLARRTRLSSTLGARFDMETDALLILLLSLLVWRDDKAGIWVIACGLMRYAFVAAGWLLPWMAGRLTPTMRGKTVAVTQFLGLSVALMPFVVPPASTVVAALTLGALTWSFAVDVGRLWNQRTADEPGR